MQTIKLPKIALVGRPNVGKSTLFNRLSHQRLAVVSDIAGTTRDRLENIIKIQDRQMRLVDMAGLEPVLSAPSELRLGMQQQVQKALHEASVVLWIVDAREGVTYQDEQVSLLLRNLNVPVIVIANKCDHPDHEISALEFAQFGFEEIVPISAIHARGIDELEEAIAKVIPAPIVEETDEEVPDLEPEEDNRELSVAIVGRPNVGKSTLLNALVGDERALVSALAGTTRDSVDSVIPSRNIFQSTFTRWLTIRLVDTAGIRRAGKIGRSIEGWSVLRSIDAIDRAQLVILMLDGVEGLVHQDLQVAEQAVQAGRGLILLVNKWDLVLAKKEALPGSAEDQKLQEAFLAQLRKEIPFLHWVQVVFISAERAINLESMGKVLLRAYNAWSTTPSEEDLLNFTYILREHPKFKNLQKITLEHSQPPTFHIHVEGKALPHFSSVRMLDNEIREAFQIGPTPMKIWVVPSVKKGHRS